MNSLTEKEIIKMRKEEEREKKKSLIRHVKNWCKEHKNFITPKIVSVKMVTEEYFLELSKGGLSDNNLYGVSVLKIKEDGKITTTHDLGYLSTCGIKEKMIPYYKREVVYLINEKLKEVI